MRKKFALITHPYDLGHVRRIIAYHDPNSKRLSDGLLTRLIEWAPSFKIGEWLGIRSRTGAEVDGVNITCPIIPRLPRLGPKALFEKIRGACRLAAELGAHIAALGGFTSIYGENNQLSASRESQIAVTTGNSLTAAMAIKGILKAAEALGVEMKRATVAIIGATGDIGAACARALLSKVKALNLAARSRPRLEAFAKALERLAPNIGRVASDNREAVADADVVLCVASSSEPILDSRDLRPGTIVCDVGYPKNVAARAAHRHDVFVFDGGLVSTPTPIDFGFDNGLPNPNVLYGCFAEGVVLALEGRIESFSVGKGRITPEKMDEIAQISARHGFDLAPFYSGGRLVSDERLGELREEFARHH